MKYVISLCLMLGFIYSLPAQNDFQKKLQTQLIMAEDGETILIPAGTHTSLGTISMDAKNIIIIFEDCL